VRQQISISTAEARGGWASHREDGRRASALSSDGARACGQPGTSGESGGSDGGQRGEQRACVAGLGDGIDDELDGGHAVGAQNSVHGTHGGECGLVAIGDGDASQLEEAVQGPRRVARRSHAVDDDRAGEGVGVEQASARHEGLGRDSLELGGTMAARHVDKVADQRLGRGNLQALSVAGDEQVVVGGETQDGAAGRLQLDEARGGRHILVTCDEKEGRDSGSS